MVKLKRSFVQCGGIKFFYLDSVENDKNILCLHGKWGRGETWNDFIKRYHSRFRIIAPDQRGHGLSDKPVARYAPQDMAEDAFQIIKQLKAVPSIVVGHSMGGRNAAHLAALYPEAVKGLVILDIGPGGSEELSQLSPASVMPIDELTFEWPTPYSSMNDAVKHLNSCFKYKSNVDYFLQSLTEGDEGYDYMFSRYSMAAIAQYLVEWTDILPRIQCPVLLVRAENSTDLTKDEAEKMQSLIKDCTYAEISKSDHMVYIDNPEEFYPIMDDFLKRF